MLVSIASGIPSNRSGASALVPMCSNYQTPLASMPMWAAQRHHVSWVFSVTELKGNWKKELQKVLHNNHAIILISVEPVYLLLVDIIP